MVKLFYTVFIISSAYAVSITQVHVAGEMKNIMMQGDFKAYAKLDTFQKKNLYGLGPVENLKGELLVMNGDVYSSEKAGKQILNKKNVIQNASMFVYSYVEKWKEVNVYANSGSYAELETLVAATAKKNGYDTTVPFVFKIEANPKLAAYHIIDWIKGEKHTMENHKQFAYSGKTENSNVTLLGFYSDHHHSIFTHHTTNMHVHVIDGKTKQVGHLDDFKITGTIKIYFPVS
jgi:acetolactate decarboxylase